MNGLIIRTSIVHCHIDTGATSPISVGTQTNIGTQTDQEWVFLRRHEFETLVEFGARLQKHKNSIESPPQFTPDDLGVCRIILLVRETFFSVSWNKNDLTNYFYSQNVSDHEPLDDMGTRKTPEKGKKKPVSSASDEARKGEKRSITASILAEV